MLARPAASCCTRSHPKGPFLAAGFRVRVLHAGGAGRPRTRPPGSSPTDLDTGSVALEMRRPRLSYKVAVDHADASQLAGMAA